MSGHAPLYQRRQRAAVSKRERLDRVAAQMRQRNQRVVRIRAAMKARRGSGPHYPAAVDRRS